MSTFINGLSVVCARNDFRRRATLSFSVPALFFLAGCSIHPVQRDVTGFRTVDIVDRIRCETRLAIQDKAIDLLINLPEEKDRDGRARAIAQELRRHRGEAWDFDPGLLPTKPQQAFYRRYVGTGIAYDFTFDITEGNKAIGAADPVRLITGGTAGIGVGATGDYSRNNSRHFVMSDTFDNLLRSKTLPCADDYQSSNYAYPIAGTIGMSELIDTFIDLNEDKQLAPGANSRVFADTMLFLTTLSGSVSPHIVLSPMGNRWGLAPPTNLALSSSRIDKHTLIVGLSMDPPKSDVRKSTAAPAVPVAGLVGRPRSALQKSSVPSGPEQGALDAVTQQRIDTYLDRARP